MITITPEESSAWRALIKDLTGIHLDSSKDYLFESRFPEILVQSGSASFSELYFKVKRDTSRSLERKVIDLITTGETSFFRDSSPFELFRYKILPELIDRKTKSSPPGQPLALKIWSAACSSGQELYTLGMILKEDLRNGGNYRIKMLGTDISDAALSKASYGVFNDLEIQRGLPPDLKGKYFDPVPQGWKVKDEIRSMATFQHLNLMQDFGFLGRWDVIFCRNVAIYFEEPEKKSLFDRLGASLEPDGALLIGATETLTGLCPQYEAKRYHRSVYYNLKGAV